MTTIHISLTSKFLFGISHILTAFLLQSSEETRATNIKYMSFEAPKVRGKEEQKNAERREKEGGILRNKYRMRKRNVKKEKKNAKKKEKH